MQSVAYNHYPLIRERRLTCIYEIQKLLALNTVF